MVIAVAELDARASSFVPTRETEALYDQADAPTTRFTIPALAPSGNIGCAICAAARSRAEA
jgi:hypothetical protein